ncbi:AAA family ATPase [Streptomyces sp. Ag109_G2-6]|uniref:AAA family ATPase n=1 Tax=Streptomyces sp. Ag109_G2-6 TaxID=2485154 RepID=UPI0037D9BE70
MRPGRLRVRRHAGCCGHDRYADLGPVDLRPPRPFGIPQAVRESLPLCRLRFTGVLHTWGFALYLAGNDSYRDNILSSGLPAGSPEEALDCAGDLYLNALAPAIRVPAGLVLLVGPPASGKTSFVQALITRRQIDAEAVVSSDEIRAELSAPHPRKRNPTQRTHASSRNVTAGSSPGSPPGTAQSPSQRTSRRRHAHDSSPGASTRR